MPSLKSSWCHGRKRTGSDVESNAVPTLGNQHQVDNAVHSRCQGVDSAPVLIDLDTLDDDIVISSARAFAEAKNNTWRQPRHRGQNVVIDLDSGHSSCVAHNTWKKRRTVSGNQEFVKPDIYINLEARNSKRLQREKAIHVVPPPPPPKELTFNCPVCIGPLVEETSTKCGHIFCKKCIKMAIDTQKKCPACRRKTTMKDIFRVYLPSTTTC